MFKTWKYRKIINKGNDLKLGYLDKKQSVLKALILIVPALAIIITFTIIPFVIAASSSFEYLPDKHDKTFIAVGTENWPKLFDDPFFMGSLKTSILYAFISVPLVLVISMLISAVLAHIGKKWLRGVFQTIFFLPYVTSAVAISLAFAFIFDLDKGLLNKITGNRTPWLVGKSTDPYALQAMLIYGVWRGIAFNVLIFTTAMLGVDKNLYKSASIDGAGPIRQFFTITLPSVNRTINFLLFLGIIGSIKVFPLALFNNDSSAALLHGGGTLLLYIFNATQENNIQMAAVSSVVLLIISISFAVIFKGSINGVIKFGIYIGDKHVSNKIKIKTMMR